MERVRLIYDVRPHIYESVLLFASRARRLCSIHAYVHILISYRKLESTFCQEQIKRAH